MQQIRHPTDSISDNFVNLQGKITRKSEREIIFFRVGNVGINELDRRVIRHWTVSPWPPDLIPRPLSSVFYWPGMATEVQRPI